MEDKKRTKRINRPWYPTELLQQRKVTRNRENVCNTYKEEHQWKAFTIERNRYSRMLDLIKRNYIIKQLTEATNNTKKLFRRVNNLLGKKNENPL